MNLLTGYDSSGDEDEDVHVPEKKSLPVKPTPVSSSSAVRANEVSDAPMKKRRAVIFSTLPIEIQSALARGSTAQDSDSDDDTPAVISSSIKSNSNRGGGLMSLLPPPKNPLIGTPMGGEASKSRPPLKVSQAPIRVIKDTKIGRAHV